MDLTAFRQTELGLREKLLGSGWLLFQVTVFPRLLAMGNGMLPVPLPASTLNFLFFSVNAGAMALIFRCYLRAMLARLKTDLAGVISAAVPLFFAYWLVNVLLFYLFQMADPSFANINDQSVADLCAENYGLMFIGTVFFVPVTEEVFHRGLIFRGLYDRSPAAAWILSVTLFCCIHVMGYLGQCGGLTFFLCFLQYVPAGIALAAAYRLSGNILAPILIHTLSNLLGMLALR